MVSPPRVLKLPLGEIMIPKNRLPTHPGEILLEEFLVPMGMSQIAFAQHLGISSQRINEIVHGKRCITPESAWLFSQALGTSPEFWMNLQNHYDLATHKPKRVVGLIAA